MDSDDLVALLNLHRFNEAEAVLAPAVAAHPENEIAVRRLEEARRRQRMPPPAPPPGPGGSEGGGRKTESTGPTYWTKAIHYDGDDPARREDVDQRHRPPRRARAPGLP